MTIDSMPSIPDDTADPSLMRNDVLLQLKNALEENALLRESHALNRIGYWNWDITLGNLTWSEEIFRIFGVEQASFRVSPESFDRVIHPDDFPGFESARRKMLEDGNPLTIEHRIIRPTGEVRHVLEHARAQRDETGRVTHVFGTVQDITLRKRNDEALRRAQKLESIGVLAAGIAHDFNNLMSGIYGYLDMAIDHSRDPKVSACLTKAMSTIDRARSLTQKLLTFSRGGTPIKKLHSLASLFDECASCVSDGSSITFTTQIDPSLRLCPIDRAQICQVIENLLRNSKEAMPEGGFIALRAVNIDLAEREHATLPAGHYVRLTLIDQGRGIPAEALPRVFDPFFTTRPSSHGLGLAICHSIVTRHGGAIEIDSMVGKGTTVDIFLPAAALPTSSSQPVTPLFIIMDDEEIIRGLLGHMLRDIGFSVICACNGTEVVEQLSAHRHDPGGVAGLIVDLTIPGGPGGKETLEMVRAIEPDIPVFAISGSSTDPIMQDPALHGFTAAIPKPFMKKDVEKLLADHLPAIAMTASGSDYS